MPHLGLVMRVTGDARKQIGRMNVAVERHGVAPLNRRTRLSATQEAGVASPEASVQKDGEG